jgi:hypothetical protein
MNIERSGSTLRVVLNEDETRLLRFALERALFIDTPAKEQAGIAAFCSKALDLLKTPE